MDDDVKDVECVEFVEIVTPPPGSSSRHSTGTTQNSVEIRKFTPFAEVVGQLVGAPSSNRQQQICPVSRTEALDSIRKNLFRRYCVIVPDTTKFATKPDRSDSEVRATIEDKETDPEGHIYRIESPMDVKKTLAVCSISLASVVLGCFIGSRMNR